MCAFGMLLGQIIGVFPLVNEVIGVGVVHAAVVVEHSAAYLQIAEPYAP